MTVHDLINIARAGGGLVLDARKHTEDELYQIARAAASEERTRIDVLNADSKTVDELISIARAGNGAVQFHFS